MEPTEIIEQIKAKRIERARNQVITRALKIIEGRRKNEYVETERDQRKRQEAEARMEYLKSIILKDQRKRKQRRAHRPSEQK